MFTRRKALLLAAGGGAVILAGGWPRSALAAKPETFATDGVAINGIDPVAYFTDGAPVAGDPAHSTDWNGATWRFASADHRAMFDADPEAYAPKYGGYCAYAVAKGGTAPTDPEAWTIHENRLYLNFSTDVRSVWLEDVPGNVARADANWPGVLE